MTLGRLETFADGVFAIAATLLIIDVGLPVDGSGSLGDELVEIWPQYAAYAISFVSIGIMWVNHHRLIRQIGRVDQAFLFLNIGLLACIAFSRSPRGSSPSSSVGTTGRQPRCCMGSRSR